MTRGQGPNVPVLITGGGTAGHTNPGIAVAQSLVAKGLTPDQIRFVGSLRGNESTIVPSAGFEIDLLPGRGISRSLSPAMIKQNIAAAAGLAKGLAQAFGLLRRHRPEVILCLGGFASVGVSVAAVVLRVPIVVTEQNAKASAANRLIGRFAKTCALPYPGTDLPNGVVTGNPILHQVLEAVESAERDDSCVRLGIDPSRFVLAVWSGSLGSLNINTEIAKLAEMWRDRSDVSIYHVIGKRDWNKFSDTSGFDDAALEYTTVEYESQMPLLLTAGDLAVCRGGASTAAEIAVVGLPAISVPLPGAPRDHQRANVIGLAEAGALVIVDDADLDAELLARLINDVANTQGEQERRSAAAAKLGRPRAADDVADLVIAHLASVIDDG